MRVLLITNYFPPHYEGGAEVVVYNTCHGLLQRGVDASILMVNARLSERSDVQRDVQGVPVHEVIYRPYWPNNPFLQVFDPRVYRSVLAEVRRVQPDLVHIHNVSGATLAPIVACNRLNVPVIQTLHDQWLLCPNNQLYQGKGLLCDPSEYPKGCNRCFRRQDFWGNIPWRRQIFSRLVQGVRLFISPSQKLVDLHVAGGYDSARFRVVPNGIKPTLYQTPSDPHVRKYARESGLFHTLLFAGAIVESKGIQTIIEAVPLLSRHVENFRLLVAGAGDAHFLAALKSLDPSTVKLLGRVPFQEMRAMYAATDLTVISSIGYENSPMVIYESMLAGTPVLGSAIGGIPELILDGETGYLFPPGDAVALTERAVQHFARSAPERRAMCHRCVEHSSTHMTLSNHFDRLQKVYDEVMGG